MKYSTQRLFVPLVVGFLLVLPLQAGERRVLTTSKRTRLMQDAANGNREAQSRVGLALAMGQEMPQNYREAVKWLSAAAEQGDPAAEHNLALMYFNGTGVKEALVGDRGPTQPWRPGWSCTKFRAGRPKGAGHAQTRW